MVYPYRHLLPIELKPGTKCQRREFGEYDTDVYCTSGNYDHVHLTDNYGHHWVEHELTMEDLEQLYNKPWIANPNGLFRIKNDNYVTA